MVYTIDRFTCHHYTTPLNQPLHTSSFHILGIIVSLISKLKMSIYLFFGIKLLLFRLSGC